jgi:hypothetical protein
MWQSKAIKVALTPLATQSINSISQIKLKGKEERERTVLLSKNLPNKSKKPKEKEIRRIKKCEKLISL